MKLEELPVSNVLVSTAIKKKKTAVRRQIYLQIEIDEMIIKCTLLVIPFLASDIILGNDWMSKNRTIINFDKGTVEIRERWISSSTMVFERKLVETLICSQREGTTYVFVINVN